MDDTMVRQFTSPPLWNRAQGCAIMVSVIIVANVTAANDWMKERQFQKLNAVIENVMVNTIRSGSTVGVRACHGNVCRPR